MSSLGKMIPANCNTVVYNPSVEGLTNIISSEGGITRLKDNKLRLLAFEMNFLNTCMSCTSGKPIIVYICYVPSDHIMKLVKLYEFAEFHFFDELAPGNEIQAFAAGNSNVTLYDHLPTDEEMEHFNSNSDRVYLISNFTNKEIRLRNDNENVTSGEKYNLHIRKEELNVTDSQRNINFAKKINAKYSLIKFRPPHYHKDEKDKRCDFNFFKGIILLPIFSGPKTSECRMIVNNYDEIIVWDYRILSHALNRWNMTTREMRALNPFSGRENPLPYQLGNQFEICVFFAILRDYFISIGHENPLASDVYSLYSQFIMGGFDNSDICK